MLTRFCSISFRDQLRRVRSAHTLIEVVVVMLVVAVLAALGTVTYRAVVDKTDYERSRFEHLSLLREAQALFLIDGGETVEDWAAAVLEAAGDRPWLAASSTVFAQTSTGNDRDALRVVVDRTEHGTGIVTQDVWSVRQGDVWLGVAAIDEKGRGLLCRTPFDGSGVPECWGVADALTTAGNAIDPDGDTPGDTELVTVPSPPRNPFADPTTPIDVEFSWDPPGHDGNARLLFYEVQRRADRVDADWAPDPGLQVVAPQTETELLVEPAVPHFYRVRVWNRVGPSLWAETDTAVMGATVPDAPTNVAVTAGNEQLEVVWDPPGFDGGAPIEQYVVEVAGPTGTLTFTVDGDTQVVIAQPLDNGVEYQVTVTAVNVVGPSVPSLPVAGVPFGPPGLVTGLAAAPGNQEVTLSWNPLMPTAAAPVSGYRLYRVTGSVDVLEAELAGTATVAHTVAGLVNGTPYQWRIAAYGDGGEGPKSAPVTGTPRTVPAAPAAPVLVAGDTQMQVGWDPPADNGGAPITGFVVQYARNETFSVGVGTRTTGPGGLTATLTGLTNGDRVWVRVAAVNIAGQGPYSAGSSAVPFGVPDAPAAPAVTPGDESLAVSWSPPAFNGGSPVTGYRVEVSADAGFSTIAGFAAVSGTSHQFDGLSNGTQYFVRVRAVNAAGHSGWSPTGSGTPFTVPSAPSAPALTPANSQMEAVWAAPTSNGGSPLTGYQVQYALNATFTSAPTTVTVAGTTRQLDGLTNGTQYFVRVRAENAAGFGPWGPAASAVPFTVPQAPVLNSVSPANGSVTAAWSVPVFSGGSAVTRYEMQWSANGAFPAGDTWSATQTGLSRTVSSLSNGTQYFVRVRAENAAGWSNWSNVRSGVPFTVPAAPAAPTLSTGLGSIHASWAAPSFDGGSPLTEYQVQRATNASFSSGVSNLLYGPSGSVRSDSGLNKTVTYHYRVRARNAAGWGPWSAGRSAAPQGTPGAPGTPNVTANGTRALTANASYGAANPYGAAIQEYQYRISHDYSTWIGPWSAGNVTTHTFGTHLATTPWVFGWEIQVQFRARNAHGWGPWSQHGSVTNIWTDILKPLGDVGYRLLPGQHIRSAQTGAYQMHMQSDGNLVIYGPANACVPGGVRVVGSAAPGRAVGVFGPPHNWMRFHLPPGNTGEGPVIGRTGYANSSFRLQNDGNFVQLNSAGTAVWSTCTGNI